MIRFLQNHLGRVAAAVEMIDGQRVYRIVGVPYARAGRFERSRIVETYEAGGLVNRERACCFPQRAVPRFFNFFMKHHMMRPEWLVENDIQTEDAFVVNIWTMDFDTAKPVLVYLHGGGDSGSGTAPIYDGAYLASRGIVVVTVTYRIGYFGYLPVFDDNGELSCNRAAQDQQAALRWVRAHISEFGGDAGNITLMGQSGGALSSLNQFLNPISQRQFDKLILCAGPMPTAVPVDGLRERFLTVLKENGIRDFAELKRLPVRKLLRLRAKNAMMDVIDGDFFARDPKAIFEACEVPEIPILIGTNDDEFSMIEMGMFYRPLGIATKARDLDHALAAKYGEYSEKLRRAVEPEAKSLIDLQIKMLETAVFHTVSYRLLEKFSQRCPIYGYRFGYVPNLYGGLRGSYHGAEVAMFFGNLDKMRIQITDQNRREMAAVQMDWLAFIRGGSIPNRERYDAASKRIIRYLREPEMVPFPNADLIGELAETDIYERAFGEYLRNR